MRVVLCLFDRAIDKGAERERETTMVDERSQRGMATSRLGCGTTSYLSFVLSDLEPMVFFFFFQIYIKFIFSTKKI